jgi:CheY-like chemotaxis protein
MIGCMSPPALRTLVVDDEQPVLDELVWMLGRDDRIDSVRAARSGAEALRVLDEGDIDLVFLDVAMPGLSGLEIARLLGRFRGSCSSRPTTRTPSRRSR